MTTTASIAELQHAGVTLEAGEAVAVAQQLIQALRHCDNSGGVEPPYGPPTAANVILNDDGSVSCAACGTTPAISEIAIFLDALLPSGSPRVPGGLRYTIARGLLEVDVPPFDSLDDFSEALMRHERGPRDEAVRGLLRRAESAFAAAPGRRADRRRARTTDLRRALREADALLYAHHLAAATPPSREALSRGHAEAIAEAGEPRRSWRSILSGSEGGPIAPPPMRRRTVAAVAVCLGSGLMLVAAGEFMHSSPTRTPVAAPVVAPAAVDTAATSPVTTMAPAVPPSERATGAPADALAEAGQASGGASTRAANSPRAVRRVGATQTESERRSVKRAARTSEADVRKARAQRTPPGVLDRLRLRWLRHAFTIRSDEL